MTNQTAFRLISSSAKAGADNMALDEALVESVEAALSPPILRFYRWDPACLSLGYSQPVADVDRSSLEAHGWGLVRRPTGGRAILHTQELTYSVVLPLNHPLAQDGVMASYRRLSRALMLGLRHLDLPVEIESEAKSSSIDLANPVCFEVPSAYELTVKGKKLIGSAQVRRRRTMLQHGSLPLAGDLTRICDALSFKSEHARAQAKDRLRARAGTVESITGEAFSWHQASEALSKGFKEAFGLDFNESEPSSTELEKADALIEQRYSNPEWTERI